MVATIAALKNAAQAASYYEADDYYNEGGDAPSRWLGKGAERLGLKGEVDSGRFSALLKGQVASQQLGTHRDGVLEHRPGWDVTFSAPKSVSVLAEVAGDRRLFEAHDRAVQTALELAEQHLAATRIRREGTVTREVTDNLVIASFRHGTSRALDPQLHTHNVIHNMTCDVDGHWRSLEPRALYQLQKQLGAIYRQELAAEVVRLGYGICESRDSHFEVEGVDATVLAAFSKRSAIIEARLAERGKDRASATAAEKQTVALDTRQTKEAVSQHELIDEWRCAADAEGWTESERRSVVAAARRNAAHDQAIGLEVAADRAVASAAASVGERNAVFSVTDLHEAAGRFGMGRIGHQHISDAIERARQNESIKAREFVDRRGALFAGVTTATNIANETALLESEARSRGQAAPLMSPVAAAHAIQLAEQRSASQDHHWNDEQRSATRQILTSSNRVLALQGAAGTAKTSTVLATVAASAKSKGIAVIALAPTASAAQVLGDALDVRADTVARHLLAPGRPGRSESLWIVDEASLLSARDAAKLLALAEARGARVLLTGDRKQLGSVEAGAAFEQLQDAGMETVSLNQILRQTNAEARSSVEAILASDARRALSALDAGGGAVLEVEDQEARFDLMSRDYAALPADVRRRTLVIEPSRAGRDALTHRIRAELVQRGELGSEALNGHRLVRRDMTRAEARDVRSYAAGDILLFSKDYVDKGVSRMTAYRVMEIDRDKANLTLADSADRQVQWHPRRWGSGKVSAFTPADIELRIGDQIAFTR